MEKIKFICATRGTSEAFFASTFLGRSLLNFRSFPPGQPIEVRLFSENAQGLSGVYNIAIDETNRSSIRLF
jgi:hypothetical protein